MRKFILSASVTLLFAIYVIYKHDAQQKVIMDLPVPPALTYDTSSLPSEIVPSPASKKGTSSLSKNTIPPPARKKSTPSLPSNTLLPPTNTQSTPSVPSKPVPLSKPVAGQYKDGTYTGNIVDAYYGNVQVSVLIQNGKIFDVKFLDHPKDRRTSQVINSQAMPYLISEAIKAQSGNVDVVSGATFTSEAFQRSLSSALVKAKN